MAVNNVEVVHVVEPDVPDLIHVENPYVDDDNLSVDSDSGTGSDEVSDVSSGSGYVEDLSTITGVMNELELSAYRPEALKALLMVDAIAPNIINEAITALVSVAVHESDALNDAQLLAIDLRLALGEYPELLEKLKVDSCNLGSGYSWSSRTFIEHAEYDKRAGSVGVDLMYGVDHTLFSLGNAANRARAAAPIWDVIASDSVAEAPSSTITAGNT